MQILKSDKGMNQFINGTNNLTAGLKNTVTNYLFLTLVSVFMVVVSSGYADAVQDVRGQYLGSYSIIVTGCTDSSSNGTYHADLVLSITTQTGNAFGGSAIGTFNIDGFVAEEYINLSGTIGNLGQLSGSTSHTFLGTGGSGLFTGQLNGDTISIQNPGKDTYGDTCSYLRNMSAIRQGNTAREKANIIFDWLESEFPEILSPAPQPTYESDGIYFRYYIGTNVYIGTIQNDLYFYDNFGVLYNLGGIDGWLTYAQGGN